MKTSIVLLTYNKLEYTKICIDSIRKYTRLGTYELIIIDNNSTDGTVEWINEQKDIVSVLNSENFGFPKGCNQGIAISTGDNVLLLNNDTIVTPNWLENLNKALYSDDNIGAVGAVTNSCANNQAIRIECKNFDEIVQFAGKYNISNSDMWEERLRLIGFCMLIRREVIEKVGLLDEIYSPGNFEDDDYSFRLRKAGYRLMLCKDTFIYHFGHTSFNENSEFGQLLKVNRMKFKNKWGFDPNYIAEVNLHIKELIEEENDSKFKLLQLGCNGGATLLDIKNKFKNSKLYGIEMQENVITNNENFAEIVYNIDRMQILEYENFDYIIIESEIDEIDNLIKLKTHLKSDGKFIVIFRGDKRNKEKYLANLKAKTGMKIIGEVSDEANGLVIFKFANEVIKDDKPLASILIPAFNRVEYLKKALESALNQTYKNIEIIICDDSTNDDVKEAMSYYLKHYENIKYYKNQENIGQFENDIKLFNLANGEYLNYLMDDDMFFSNKIEKMMDYYLDDEKKEIKLITSSRQIIDEKGYVIQQHVLSDKLFEDDKISDGKVLANFMLVNNYNFIGEPTTVLFRKDALEESFGVFNGRRYGCNVDHATWLNLLCKGKAVYIAEPLSCFRIHNNQQLATEKMKLLGANDYAHEVLTSREKGFLSEDFEFQNAVEKCYKYCETVTVDLKGKIIDENLYKELKINMEKLYKLLYKKPDTVVENNVYRELKLLLIKMENGIELELNKNKVVELLVNKNINVDKMIQVIDENVLKKEEMLNTLAIETYNIGLYEEVLSFLQRAYEINNCNKDTVYNLAYILHIIGENELALRYLDKFNGNDEDVLRLSHEIRSSI